MCIFVCFNIFICSLIASLQWFVIIYYFKLGGSGGIQGDIDDLIGRSMESLVQAENAGPLIFERGGPTTDEGGAAMDRQCPQEQAVQWVKPYLHSPALTWYNVKAITGTNN